MTKYIKKFISVFLIMAMIVPLFTELAKAATETNFARITLFDSRGQRVKNQPIELAGKVYTSNESGEITTEQIPYGRYVPKILPRTDNQPGDVTWDYTVLSQGITISRFSHLDSMKDFGNIYLFREFVLGVSVVDINNKPIPGMIITAQNQAGKVVLYSTVATCVYGAITWNWQELPAGDGEIKIGDELKIVVKHKNGLYKEVSQDITLDSPSNSVKLVALQEGQQNVNFAPEFYESRFIESSDNKKIAHLIFDNTMKLKGKPSAAEAILDKNLFSLKDQNNQIVPIESATFKKNTVDLTFDKQYTPSTVSYDNTKSEFKLMNEMNMEIPVQSFNDKKLLPYSQTAEGKVASAKYQLYEDAVIRLVNEERARAGIHALSNDLDLKEMSVIKNNDQIYNSYLEHNSPVYGLWYEQNKLFGLRDYKVTGENVASVPTTMEQNGMSPEAAAAAVFAGWKNSPGHYANIMSRDFTRISVAYSPKGYWTQNFASSQSDIDNFVKVTATPEPGAKGSATLNTYGILGTQTTVTAIPYQSYSFKNWTNKDTGEVIEGADSTYTFTVSGAINLQANFEKAKYKITTDVKSFEYINGVPVITNEVGGSVTTTLKSGTTTVDPGQKLTVTATPNDGYVFLGYYYDKFEIDGETVPYPNTKKSVVEITATGNTTLIAVFKKIKDANIVIRGGDKKYKAVFSVPTPNLTRIDAVDKIDKTQEFGVKKAGIFKDGKSFTLDGVGSIPGLIKDPILLGLESYDNKNYKFIGWKDISSEYMFGLSYMEGLGGYNNTGVVDRLTSNEMILEPVFDESPYKVNVKTSTNGIVKGIDKAYAYNETVNLTAVPNAGYKFDHWSDLKPGDTYYSDANRSLVFSELVASTIKAYQYEAKPIFSSREKVNVDVFTTTPEAGEVFGGDFYKNSTAVLIATIKNTNYIFDGWYNGDEKVSSQQLYMIYNIDTAMKLEARYTPIKAPYSLTINADENAGSVAVKGKDTKARQVTLNEPESYYYLDQVSMTATPKAGYFFVGWYKGTQELGIHETLTTTIYDSTEIDAKFMKNEQITYIFKDFDGKVLKIDTVDSGGNITPPVAPTKLGYDFKGWSIDNFTDVKSNMFVEAVYQKNNEKFVISVNNGKVNNGETKAEFTRNQVVNIVADAAPLGQKFSHWEVLEEIDGKEVAKIVSYETTYKFCATRTITYRPVFINMDDTVVKQPIASVSSQVTPNVSAGKLAFEGQIYVPTGFKLIECGMLLMTETNYTESTPFTLNSTNVIKGKSASQNTSGQFIINKAKVGSGESYYGRTYLTYRNDAGDIVTTYSDIVNGTLK